MRGKEVSFLIGNNNISFIVTQVCFVGTSGSIALCVCPLNQYHTNRLEAEFVDGAQTDADVRKKF